MPIGEADGLSVTVVIDNYVDLLLAEKPNLKRGLSSVGIERRATAG